MPPHVLIHAGHVLKEALTGATEEGGGWAWIGLIAGGFVGFLVTFGDGEPMTEGMVVIGIILVGMFTVLGGYVGVLGKLLYDRSTGNGQPPK